MPDIASLVHSDREVLSGTPVFVGTRVPVRILFEFLSAGDLEIASLDTRVRSAFGYPCYVKPANLGSSVGVSRAAGG